MKKLFVYLLATFCIGSTAFAQTPQLLNYQGVARNGFGNALPNRLMTLRLSIRNGGSSGAIVYQETRSVTTNAGGLYSVQIGSTGTSSVVGSMATINWQVGTKFLQVEVDPEAGTNFIDLGTTQLVSVPYAMSAGVATPVGAAGGDLSGTYPNPTVANGAINTIKLADAAVTTFKLADQSVTTTKLSDYSVTNSKLADGAVTTAKVTDGNITTAKLADAAVTTAKLADANVTTGKLADASVTDAKIVTVAGSKVTGNISGNAANVTGIVAVANGGTGATTAASARTNLGLGNVDNTSDLNKPISTATQTALDLKENLSNKSTSTSLGTSDALYPTQNAVKSYVDGQIVSNATPDATTLVKGKVQLAGDLTGTAALPTVAAGAITTTKLADGAVTTAKVTDANITTAKLADAAVTTAKLTDANVTTAKLADASVTDAKIVTVSGSKVTGNITGNAANVTGTVALANGGTGATTAAAARTSLGSTTVGSNLFTLTNPSAVTFPRFNADNTVSALDAASFRTAIGAGTSSTSGTVTSVALSAGTSGTDVNISGSPITSNGTITINIPDASATARGVVTTSSQTFTGTKTFSNDIVVNSVAIGKGGATQADNIAIGNGARSGNINTGGNANIAIGTDAQKNNTGFYNVSVGNSNLVNGSGDENTALGYTVMANNTTGMRNTGVGLFSFYQNTTGNYNTAIGHSSLSVNTTGSYNTVVGASADVASNNLTNATAIGYGATVAASNTIQLGNSSVTNVKTSGTLTAGAVTYPNTDGTNGYYLKTNGSGTASWAAVTSGATSVGAIANTSTAYGASITSGVLNLAPANASNGGVVTTGSQTFAGGKTFTSNINVNNISVGSPGGSQNTMFGNASFGWSSPGSNNTGLGFFTLASSQGGNDNTAVGTNAIRQGGSANGSRNTAVGSAALSNGAASNDNVAIGVNTLNGTTGGKNIAIGTNALVSSSTAEENIGVGYYSLYSSTAGGYNTAIGAYSMYNNTTGDVNVAAGHKSLFGNTTGRYNTSLGVQSQEQNTTGSQNVAIGVAAIDQNATGNNNAVLGAFAGRHFGANYVFMTDRTTKIDNSILIGYDARPLVNNSSNEIVIGYNAVGNGSNTAQIGNSSITNVKTSGTITAGAVTYPNTDGTANQVLTTNGSGVASWSTPTAAVTTVGSIAGSSTANGATISGSTITLAPADGTNGGIITTTAQTIAGDKTFTGTIRGKVAVSSEITSDLTITSSNAETYNSQILICNPTSGAITITFNSGLPAGFNCMILQKSANANKINIAAGSGVTINNRNSYTATAGQYALATIVHIGSNVLVTAGDMQ